MFNNSASTKVTNPKKQNAKPHSETYHLYVGNLYKKERKKEILVANRFLNEDGKSKENFEKANDSQNNVILTNINLHISH